MTQMEALELALRLAIAAPDRKRMLEVIALADQIRAGMDPEEVKAVQEGIKFDVDLHAPTWKV